MKTPKARDGWCARPRVRRVPPLQGGEDLFGPSSQGVALGCRVVAPLARKHGCANGAIPVSPGQRPGNSATNKMISPERATPGGQPAKARDLEQTIAGNVAEILEACGSQIMASGMAGHDRVWPFQGGGIFVCALSQGVALGWRVVAPLARTMPRPLNLCLDQCANGAKPISLGQRPRNSATHKFTRPEGATRGTGNAQARDLEQTIAGNVAEILEA